MFCPGCGVKNEAGVLKCFVCKRILPSGDTPQNNGIARPRVWRRVASAPVVSVGAVGDRMLAVILDRVLLAALVAAPLVALTPDWNRFRSTWAIVLSVLAAVVLIFVYHLLLEGTVGSTIGKAIFGLRVETGNGRGRFASIAIRNALRLVDALGLYAVAFLVAIFSARKQRLGDHIAGTFVVEQRMHWTARAAVIVLWLLCVGGAAWFVTLSAPSLLEWLAHQIA